MRPLEPPQIHPDKIVTSAGLIIDRHAVVGVSVNKEKLHAMQWVIFMAGIAFFVNFLPALMLAGGASLASFSAFILVSIWSVIGIFAVGVAFTSFGEPWRVFVYTNAGELCVFESRREDPARKVAAAIYDATFPSSGPR